MCFSFSCRKAPWWRRYTSVTLQSQLQKLDASIGSAIFLSQAFSTPVDQSIRGNLRGCRYASSVKIPSQNSNSWANCWANRSRWWTDLRISCGIATVFNGWHFFQCLNPLLVQQLISSFTIFFLHLCFFREWQPHPSTLNFLGQQLLKLLHSCPELSGSDHCTCKFDLPSLSLSTRHV